MNWNMKTTYFEDKMSWWFTKSVMKILSKSLARYTTKLSSKNIYKKDIKISRMIRWDIFKENSRVLMIQLRMIRKVSNLGLSDVEIIVYRTSKLLCHKRFTKTKIEAENFRCVYRFYFASLFCHKRSIDLKFMILYFWMIWSWKSKEKFHLTYHISFNFVIFLISSHELIDYVLSFHDLAVLFNRSHDIYNHEALFWTISNDHRFKRDKLNFYFLFILKYLMTEINNDFKKKTIDLILCSEGLQSRITIPSVIGANKRKNSFNSCAIF